MIAISVYSIGFNRNSSIDITVLLQLLLCPLFEVYGKLGKIIVLTR